jgi:xylan 1,4-beta-xylosidase
VRQFAKFQRLPIILSEADPEGCAACSARLYPPNAYRNGPLYPSYTAAAMKGLLELADRAQVNLLGMLTWAFEFEGKPYFDGYRTLATNGVDKPVLNVFRMAGLMRGNRVAAVSNGAAPLDSILAHSVRILTRWRPARMAKLLCCCGIITMMTLPRLALPLRCR